MSRDGNGVYNLPVNSWNPAVDGNAATIVDWQSLIDDVATALTQSVSSDGQTPMTGDLNMNGNRIESLAAGTSTTDAANVGQIYNQGTEQDVASSATADIGIVNSNFIRITGTTTITSLGTNYRGPKFVRFSDALILTHNSSTLILPGGVNITTSAGDMAIFVPKGNPSDGWNCVVYQYATGQKITGNLVVTGNATLGDSTSSDAHTINGTATVSADSASAALKVTQIGSGLTAHFEDEASDTTPIVITAAGELVVGSQQAYATNISVSPPTIQINSATAVLATQMIASWASGTDAGARLILSRSDSGTVGTHTAIGNSDILGNIDFMRSNGTTFVEGAKFRAVGNGSTGTDLEVYTSTIAGTLVSAGGWNGSSQRFYNQPSYDTTTASAANLVISSSGLLARSTSTLSVKSSVEAAKYQDALDLLKIAEVIWYRSACAEDNPDFSHYGLAAEQVAAINPRFAQWGHVSDDYETVEESLGFEEVQVMIDEEYEHQSFVIKNGKAVLCKETRVRQVPKFELYPAVDESGKPILEAGEPVLYKHFVTEKVERFKTVKKLKPKAKMRPVGVAYERVYLALMLVVQKELLGIDRKDELSPELKKLCMEFSPK